MVRLGLLELLLGFLNRNTSRCASRSLFDLVSYLFCPGQDLLRLFLYGVKRAPGMCLQVFGGLGVFLADTLIFKKSSGFNGGCDKRRLVHQHRLVPCIKTIEHRTLVLDVLRRFSFGLSVQFLVRTIQFPGHTSNWFVCHC